MVQTKKNKKIINGNGAPKVCVRPRCEPPNAQPIMADTSTAQDSCHQKKVHPSNNRERERERERFYRRSFLIGQNKIQGNSFSWGWKSLVLRRWHINNMHASSRAGDHVMFLENWQKMLVLNMTIFSILPNKTVQDTRKIKLSIKRHTFRRGFDWRQSTHHSIVSNGDQFIIQWTRFTTNTFFNGFEWRPQHHFWRFCFTIDSSSFSGFEWRPTHVSTVSIDDQHTTTFDGFEWRPTHHIFQRFRFTINIIYHSTVSIDANQRIISMISISSFNGFDRRQPTHLSVVQWFRLTILCASRTSASLAGDFSRDNTADMAFSACTTAMSFARAIPSDLCTSSSASSTSPVSPFSWFTPACQIILTNTYWRSRVRVKDR